MIIGAAGFGLTGIFWGQGMYPEGGNIIFLPFNFWLVTAIWGLILGILSLNWRTAIRLAILGLVAGIASIIVGNLGVLFFIIILGLWFISYTLLPMFFLIFGYNFYSASKKIHAAAFFILFISAAIDWALIVITYLGMPHYPNHLAFGGPVYPAALLFAGIGLMIGAIIGYGIQKTETMALFCMIGFTIGSYWMSIYSDPYAYMTDANDILVYTHMAATMGVFMVAGLFYPEKEKENDAGIPSTD